ncbi:ribonuclease HII [Coralliovum pocilloporae]|uniref:ribonuclease HII n=1 Tax=Coralliovum pocilloporae TaxID=3066369 RepID=UPI003306D02A
MPSSRKTGQHTRRSSHQPPDHGDLFPEPDEPTYQLEADAITRHGGHVAGVDEAGRGPLAGPVVTAAVILDPKAIPDGLDDSKKLSATKRDALFDAVTEAALAISVCSAAPATIDRLNIRAATLQAMSRSVAALALPTSAALIDGRDIPPGLPCPGSAIIKGDGRSLSIAAASIIAKVTRDRMMEQLEQFYPGYGLGRHMGYGTKMHREALERLGPSPCHRLSFAPVARAEALAKALHDG